MSLWQLRYHNEKVQFLLDYLNERLEEFPLDTPLMIYGSGRNGKSKVFQEIVEQSPVPIVVFTGEGNPTFYPTQNPCSKLAVLIICNGTPEDIDFAEFLRDSNYTFGE